MSQQRRKTSRRQFIKTAAGAGAGVSLFQISGTKASGRIIGANERIRIGVVGIKGRGSGHVSNYVGMKNVEVSHLIDIDSSQFDLHKKHIREKDGNEPVCVQDVREALEDKNLDAISIATCNHTHSLYTVWGCQAGKHVYVEKPMSHNVWEGRKCIEAAKKYNVLVQHGTQQRSSVGRANEIAAVPAAKPSDTSRMLNALVMPTIHTTVNTMLSHSGKAAKSMTMLLLIMTHAARGRGKVPGSGRAMRSKRFAVAGSHQNI